MQRRNYCLRFFISMCSVLLVLIVFANTASAKQQTGIQLHFRLTPAMRTSDPRSASSFILSGKPGDYIQNSFLLTDQNIGQKNLDTVSLFAVDGQTGLQGGDSYPPDPTHKHDLGGWIHINVSQNKLTMFPGAEKEISFTIKIPKDARVGEHFASIDAVPPIQTATPTTINNGARNLNANLNTGGGVRILLTVAGKTQTKLQAKNVLIGGQQGAQFVVISLVNVGDMLVHPKGTIVIDAQGSKQINQKLSIAGILPQTELNYQIAAPHLQTGNYTAMLDLTYENNGSIHKQFSFSISPETQTKIFEHSKTQAPQQNSPNWFLIIGISFTVFLLVIVGLLIFALARSTRKNPPPPDGNQNGSDWNKSTFPYTPPQLDVENHTNGVVQVEFLVPINSIPTSFYGVTWPNFPQPPKG